MDCDPDDVHRIRDASVFFAQYILYSQRQKKGCLKDADIRNALAKVPGSLKRNVIETTIKYLKHFGIKVVIEETPGGYRQLYVGNELQINPNAYDDEDDFYSPEEKAKYGLLLSILMMIQMLCPTGYTLDGVSEETLWGYLDKMGILHEECFGGKDELSKLVGPSHNAEFISQGEGSKSVKLELDRHTSPSGRFGAAWALFLNIRWISFKKSTSENGKDIVTYCWGRRAEHFIDPLATLRIVCEADGSKPEDWKMHFAAAVAANQKRLES